MNIPYLSGRIVNSLRNSIIHEGNPNIDKNKFEITKFNLFKYNGRNRIDTLFSVKNLVDEENNHENLQKDFIVSIRELCMDISSAAIKYYRENREKFQFINYIILDWNERKNN